MFSWHYTYHHCNIQCLLSVPLRLQLNVSNPYHHIVHLEIMFIVEGPYLGVVLEEGAELGEGPELGKTTSRRLFSSVAPHEVYDPNISTIVVATFYAA